MHLHHGLLFRLRQHRLAAGYTKALMHPRAETALGTQQLIPHSAPPPQTSLSTLFFPAEKRVYLPFRPPSRYSIRQKTPLQRAFGQIFPCVPCCQKLSKILCSFDIVFLFKYDFLEKLSIINILLKALPPGELAQRACEAFQKMIFAVVARAALMRSAAAQHTCVPMRPPET